jgi:hypothetical protein
LLQQPFLDTTNGFGEVLLALFGWMAAEERRGRYNSLLP